ncbi:MAG: MraY family glycosyltransferase [Candidatus Brocadiia bacterium]
MGHDGLLPLIASFLASAAFCAGFMAISPRIGFLDRPGGRKAHDRPIPLGGGPAIFGALAFTFLLLTIIGSSAPFAELGAGKIAVAIAGLVAVFAIGLMDDIRPIGPIPKLAAEIAVASALYLAGFRITGFVYFPLINYLMTVLWFTLIINAFNLLDSHDGLSSGIAVVCATMLFIVEGTGVSAFSSALLPAVVGAAAGFLLFNFPPARLYMGDAGALILGYSLALASIDATFYAPGSGRDPLFAMFTPMLIFAVPIYDTVSVMLIRAKSGKPLFVGDRNHLPHRLVLLGMTKREALLVIYLLSVAASSGAVYLTGLARPEATLVVLQTVAFIVVLFILERLGGRNR